MKNILLDEALTSTEYGHYISYSSETDSVSYDFRYGRIPSNIIEAAYTKILGITGTPQKVAQYGKSGVSSYCSATWETLIGNLDSDTIGTLSPDYYWFANTDSVIVTPDGAELDCPHFWATLSSLYAGHGDLGGWAGDLVQYAKDLKSNSDLEFPAASFGSLDWYADLDAYNLYNLNKTDLGAAMKSYWTEDLTEKSRITGFMGTDTTVAAKWSSSTDSSYLGILTATYGVSDSDIIAAIGKMQTYIDSIR